METMSGSSNNPCSLERYPRYIDYPDVNYPDDDRLSRSPGRAGQKIISRFFEVFAGFTHSEHHSSDAQDVLRQVGVEMYTDSIILSSWSAPSSC